VKKAVPLQEPIIETQPEPQPEPEAEPELLITPVAPRPIVPTGSDSHTKPSPPTIIFAGHDDSCEPLFYIRNTELPIESPRKLSRVPSIEQHSRQPSLHHAISLNRPGSAEGGQPRAPVLIQPQPLRQLSNQLSNQQPLTDQQLVQYVYGEQTLSTIPSQILSEIPPSETSLISHESTHSISSGIAKLQPLTQQIISTRGIDSQMMGMSQQWKSYENYKNIPDPNTDTNSARVHAAPATHTNHYGIQAYANRYNNVQVSSPDNKQPHAFIMKKWAQQQSNEVPAVPFENDENLHIRRLGHSPDYDTSQQSSTWPYIEQKEPTQPSTENAAPISSRLPPHVSVLNPQFIPPPTIQSPTARHIHPNYIEKEPPIQSNAFTALHVPSSHDRPHAPRAPAHKLTYGGSTKDELASRAADRVIDNLLESILPPQPSRLRTKDLRGKRLRPGNTTGSAANLTAVNQNREEKDEMD
jgi:hypothetical protein